MMIETILIKTILSLSLSKILTNPKIPIQDSYYPSGVKEADKYYKSDKPAIKNPLLKLDLTVYDPEYNKLEAGIYSVEYLPDLNSLLISNNDIDAKAPVFQIIKLKQKVYIPVANVYFVRDNKIFIIYKKENLEVHAFLYLPEAVLNKN